MIESVLEEFGPVLNSELTCRDCIYREKSNISVRICKRYPERKPSEVVHGGKCPEKVKQKTADGKK